MKVKYKSTIQRERESETRIKQENIIRLNVSRIQREGRDGSYSLKVAGPEDRAARVSSEAVARHQMQGCKKKGSPL